MSFREQVALDALEPAHDLVHEAAHLSEMASARTEVLLEAVLNCLGETYLQLGRGLGQRLDRLARPLERGLDRRRRDAPLGGVRDPLVRSFECAPDSFVHGDDNTPSTG